MRGYVYLREFEDGWVAVNPARQGAVEVPVPSGTVRVLTHDTFKTVDQTSPIVHFDLPVHRGIVLLKAGRHVGNSDNGPQ